MAPKWEGSDLAGGTFPPSEVLLSTFAWIRSEVGIQEWLEGWKVLNV
jgi:hypothetical protein